MSIPPPNAATPTPLGRELGVGFPGVAGAHRPYVVRLISFILAAFPFKARR
jgi:hypothetical protein